MTQPAESDRSPTSLAPPSRWLWWLQPKVAIPLALLLLLLLAPFLYRAHRIALVPDVGPPFDLQAFESIQLADNDNAVPHYRRAAALLKKGSTKFEDLVEQIESADGDWNALPQPLRDCLADNQKALTEWRSATELDQALFVRPADLAISTPLELHQVMREFAQLAWLQAELHRSQGDVHAAWEWLNTSVRASRHHGQKGVMIQRLVGAATLNIAACGIVRWAADPRVDAELLRKALDDYLAAEKLSESDATAWKCEYAMLHNTLTGKDRISPNELVGNLLPEFPLPLTRPALYLQGEPEFSLRVVRMMFQIYLNGADQPVGARSMTMSGGLIQFRNEHGEEVWFPVAELMRLAKSPSLARAVLPNYDQLQRWLRRETARRLALRLTLAAQLYRRRHGDWPATLENLVPELLPELPLDPFSASGETLRLKRDGNDLLLYSVGHDAIDHGGALTGGNEPPDEGFRALAPKITQ